MIKKTPESAKASADGTIGTDHLWSFIQFLILASQKLMTIDADGNKKITMMEAMTSVTPLLFKVPGLLNDLPAIREEWKDITDEELTAIAEKFAAEFDLPMEKKRLETIIKKSAAMLVYNFNFAKDIKALLAK